MTHRRRHPVLLTIVLGMCALGFHALGLDGFVVAEVILVAFAIVLKLRIRQNDEAMERDAEIDVEAVVSERDELARQMTAAAAEWHRYKALLAVALLDHPEGMKVTPEMARAAGDLEVYVTPTADGGLEARAGYPVQERSA